ncbi:RNA methyltransferase [Aeromonas diversa CDC 2478-85]|uniref:RNA methyltransferase n=1 Tax=Aeromonas diversa CDC 2478-85 TaxID=1268237 RepID=N9VQW8_9GAMM|nr:23S rRNA (uracil(1939)-C(5))-methyltransferase RlmD [Aeromonas diversa]ENY73953.1 RNA methyltransferase [Aeromonas diversa CDC 2478-85]
MSAVGERRRIQILELTDKGDGVGRAGDIPVYVEGALPGEEVEISLTLVKPNYQHGHLEEVVVASPDRVADFCAHTECGGCQVRPLAYPAQLKLKQSLVQGALEQVGLGDAVVNPILGMETPFAYRNKAQYAVRGCEAGAEIGFYRKHSHDLITADDCAVQDSLHVELNARVRSWMRAHDIKAYDEVNHTGCVRNLMTRKGFKSGELMVVLVTLGEALPFEAELLAALQDLPITTLVQNINDERTNRILGDNNRVLLGSGVIRDKIHELDFEISPLSFFQNNPSQTDVLYSKALEYCELTGNETVFDIYCGIGTISLFLAGKAAKVVGIESVESAISDARRNATLNGIEQTEFHVGKAERLMPELHAQGVSADVVVMDPPRKGCDKAVLQTLVAMAPRRLVYVSCNPQTLARDLAWLVKQGFVLDEVQPVDMFPHSMHVEAVARLSLPAKG